MASDFNNRMRDHAIEPQLTVPGGAHHTRDTSRDLHADFRPQALSGSPGEAARPRRRRGGTGVAVAAIALCVGVVGVGAYLASGGHNSAPSRNLPLTANSAPVRDVPAAPLPSSAPLLVAPPAARVPEPAPAKVVEAPPPPKPVPPESDAFRGMLQPKIAPVAPSSPVTPAPRTAKAEPAPKAEPVAKAETKAKTTTSVTDTSLGKADPNWAMQNFSDTPRVVAPAPSVKAPPVAVTPAAAPVYGTNSVTVGGTTYVAGQEPRSLGTMSSTGSGAANQ